MNERILFINIDREDELVNKISGISEIKFENNIKDITLNDIGVMIIDIDNINIDELMDRLEKDDARKVSVILRSSREISLKLLMHRNIVDYIDSNRKIDFELKKIRKMLDISRYKSEVECLVSANNKSIEMTQAVVLRAMVELVECRDYVTGGHMKRTAKYTELLAEALVEEGVYTDYLTPDFISTLVVAAPLHDVGKIGVNDATLRKSTALNEDEFEEMKRHVTLGVDAINKVINETGRLSFFLTAKEVAGTHHENWDGTGYPNGLKGEEIPICGRIMALVDVYDAVTTERPYKKAFSHEEAIEMMSRSMKGKFDPEILKVFIKHHERFKNVRA